MFKKPSFQPVASMADANVVFAESRFARASLEALGDTSRSTQNQPSSWRSWFRRRNDLAVALHNLLRSLRGRHDWRGHTFRRLRSATKYMIRVACLPRQHTRFLGFIFAEPAMRAYVNRDPRLLERHFHRYVNLNWNRYRRLQTLREHYRFVLKRLPTNLVTSIYAHGRADLGVLSLKDGSTLRLCLRPPIRMGCEGELCIELNDVNDRSLYRIIFSVIDDQSALVIGCLQGPDGENGRDMVRTLTRNLHGMRPKQLMLALAYAFARHFRIERLHAIANSAHPLRRRGRKFHADYDAFWLEQRGIVDGEGWFELPVSLAHKSAADVPSNHRSAFRRREALRLEAEHMLVEALGSASVSHWVPLPTIKNAPSIDSQARPQEVSWIN